MGRKLREHATGVAFHITARMLDHWFKAPVIERAEQIILEGIAASDALLLAHIVMPNHFHLVIRSGSRTLGWIMQPIMRRLALLVNQTQIRRGPVFEGRFRSHACDDADHVRRAIIYVHNNALRKRLCDDVLDYQWQSHGCYCGQRVAEARFIDVSVGLNLFLSDAMTDGCDPRLDYLKYFAWRREKDRFDRIGVPFDQREPHAHAGDSYFREHFAVRPTARSATRPDLRDYAALLVQRIEPGAELASFRSPHLPKHHARIRRELICALIQRGYRGAHIATLFRISGAAVSKCASQMRYNCVGTKLRK
jgi:hypothetical protein